jgi:putative endonuclease
MYKVYAIESENTGRIYIGQTNNIQKRLKMHNMGYVKSTYKDMPWHLLAIESFDTRNEARWRERQLKKSKGIRMKWLAHFKV